MHVQQYTWVKFRADSKAVLKQALTIMGEYAAKGFDLTLRQLYYQFVARGWLANNERNYKRLGGIISDGRLAGVIPWDAICDRTRHCRISPHWNSPADILISAASQFAVDKWKDQKTRVEVWIEKDALVDVIAGPCQKWDVPYLSCRGYVSQSELWRDAQRHIKWAEDEGQDIVILHLGDHDPSGIDMSRDIANRLGIFDDHVELKRIALTMDQVDELQPPPNPAKVTDVRFAGYEREYGDQSWELDALPPEFLVNLVEKHIEEIVDEDLWNEQKAREDRGREKLMVKAKRLASEWKKEEEK